MLSRDNGRGGGAGSGSLCDCGRNAHAVAKIVHAEVAAFILLDLAAETEDFVTEGENQRCFVGFSQLGGQARGRQATLQENNRGESCKGKGPSGLLGGLLLGDLLLGDLLLRDLLLGRNLHTGLLVFFLFVDH